MAQTEVDVFLSKVVEETSGSGVTIIAALGDRLGLSKDFVANCPARAHRQVYWFLWVLLLSASGAKTSWFQ